MIQTKNDGSLKATLLDYSQIHHKDFHYCKQYDCFTSNPLKRIKEDLHNTSGKLGKGFKAELLALERELGLDNILSLTFEKHYQE